MVIVAVSYGCSTTTVVLLPDQDGQVGKVEVQTEGGSQVLSEAGQATTIRGKQSSPSTPARMSEKKIQNMFSKTMNAQPPIPSRFILYFKFDSAKLDAASRELIPDILKEIKARPLDISVIGHTDRMGDEAYNINLSLKRARAVRQILVSHGASAEHIEVDSHGEGNPLVLTLDNIMEPKNRRVEVTIR